MINKKENTITERVEILLREYMEFPEFLLLKIIQNGDTSELPSLLQLTISNILLMIKDVEFGFEGTYDEWLNLKYDENDYPFLN